MSDENMREERQGILDWLFNAIFGRSEASEEEIGERIHRLGTLNRRLDDD